MEAFEMKRCHLERRSTSERPPGKSRFLYFTTIAGIILLTSAILVVMHFSLSYKNLAEEITLMGTGNAEKLLDRPCNQQYCFSEDCVGIASRILELMNPEADPCDDFYEYACGGYRRKNIIPYGQTSYSPAKEAQKDILISIRKLMESPPSASESQTMGKIRLFYETCMNEENRDQQENRTLSFWFADIGLSLENFRSVDSMDERQSNSWREIVSKLEEYQIHTILKPRFLGSPPNTIVIDCPVPFLDPQAYLSSQDQNHEIQMFMYKEVIREVLNLLSMDQNRKKHLASEILLIETNIARGIQESTSKSSYLSEELKQQIREIWLPVIGEAVQEMDVVSTCKHGLTNIFTVLNNAPNKLATEYVAWRMLIQVMQYSGNGFRKVYNHYISRLPGFDYAFSSKWEECSDVVRQELGLAVARELIEARYIQPETIAAVKEEFLEIKTDMALTLNSLTESTNRIRILLDKFRSMKLNLGYSDLLNQSIIDTMYSNLEVEDNYFANIINLKRFKTRHFLTKLWYGNPDNPISQICLEVSVLETFSDYHYSSNTVHMGFGLIRPPIFLHSQNAPKYLKYGPSSILAREMSRAYDYLGIQYDNNGRQTEWPSMDQKYDNMTSCILRQALQLPYYVQEKVATAKGVNNVIVDLESFIITYEGLLRHLRHQSDEKELPGLELTKKQIYYLQTAQMYCELRSKPSSDPEAAFLYPSKFRVNGAVSNMESFGSVFNCPVGTPMNPEGKCRFR